MNNRISNLHAVLFILLMMSTTSSFAQCPVKQFSPDGKWIAFLTFMSDVDPSDHPFYRHVYLRLMPVDGVLDLQ